MKKFIWLILWIPCLSLAQDVDTLATDSLIISPTELDSIVAPKHTFGAYGLAGLQLTPNPEGLNEMTVLGFGIRYDRLEVGFILSRFDGSIQRRLVFPNAFSLDYEHGGGFLSYCLWSSKWYSVSPSVSFQRGDMIWERLDNGEDFLRETYNLYQIGVKLETPYLKYVRPGLEIGYQRMQEIQLTDVLSSDFSGIFVGFTIKIGYFNQ